MKKVFCMNKDLELLEDTLFTENPKEFWDVHSSLWSCYSIVNGELRFEQPYPIGMKNGFLDLSASGVNNLPVFYSGPITLWTLEGTQLEIMFENGKVFDIQKEEV